MLWGLDLKAVKQMVMTNLCMWESSFVDRDILLNVKNEVWI